MVRNYKRLIRYVYVFRNGMVAVYDQNDEQMPFFQGPKKEAMPRIKRRLDRQKGIVEWRYQ